MCDLKGASRRPGRDIALFSLPGWMGPSCSLESVRPEKKLPQKPHTHTHTQINQYMVRARVTQNTHVYVHTHNNHRHQIKNIRRSKSSHLGVSLLEPLLLFTRYEHRISRTVAVLGHAFSILPAPGTLLLYPSQHRPSLPLPRSIVNNKKKSRGRRWCQLDTSHCYSYHIFPV